MMTTRRAWALILTTATLAFAGCVGPGGPAPEPAPDASPPEPRLLAASFDGSLPCGVGTPEASLNLCLGDNVAPLRVEPGLKTLLVAIDWTPTTELGGALHLYIETWGHGEALPREDSHRYWSGMVKPGQIVRIDNGTMEPADHDWDALKHPEDLQLRVFPARTLPPSVMVQQKFTLHSLLAYDARAPADADPAHPPAEA